METVIVWLLFILPWISLFFLKQDSIRRYMPVALLATVYSTLIGQLAWKYNWWEFKVTLFPWDRIAPLFTAYGVFLVGTIWIFNFTYGRFWVYMIVNIIVDFFYGFIFAKLLGYLNIRESGVITPSLNLLLMTIIAVLLYVYQIWQEKGLKKSP